MNLKRQIQSSVLGSGDYYQSVYSMIIIQYNTYMYYLAMDIQMDMQRTCEPSKCSTDITWWWCWYATIQLIFCDWVSSLHAFATVISLLKRIRCMSLPSLWLQLMLRCCACIIQCIIYTASSTCTYIFFCRNCETSCILCAPSQFSWYGINEVYTRLGEARYKMIEAIALILHRMPFSNNSKCTHAMCSMMRHNGILVDTSKRTGSSINLKIIHILSWCDHTSPCAFQGN